MKILIPVGSTPTGVGIGQEQDRLWAISACCQTTIVFNWDENYDYNCDGCGKEIKDPPCRNGGHEIDSNWASIELSAFGMDYMRQFVKWWTHLEDDDFKIKVT